MTKSKVFQAAIAAALATTAIVSTMPTPASAVTFKDVETVKDTEMKNAIYNLAHRGIVTGIGNSNYGPNNPITRAAAAKIIAEMLNLDIKNVVNPNFKDVPKSQWYYPYIAALANLNIINGYDGKFNPNGNIKRGDMAKIISEAFSITSSSTTHPFTDVKSNHYAKKYIASLYANNIAKGVTATSFGVDSSVTRGQLAIFAVRAENHTKQQTVGLTLKASDYGFKQFNGTIFDTYRYYTGTETATEIKINATSEGQGMLILKGTPLNSNYSSEAFYLVNVENKNGKLSATLEKANQLEYINYSSQYYDYRELNLNFTPALASLKTKAGKDVSSSLNITFDKNGFDLRIYEPGNYVLTLESGRNTKTFAVDVTLKNFDTLIDLN